MPAIVTVSVALALVVTLLLAVRGTTQCRESTMTTAVSVTHSTSVTTGSHALRAEDGVKGSAPVWAGMGPFLDSLEHCTMGIIAHVAQRWVMEDLHAVIEDLVLGDIGVLPSVQNARRDVLYDCRGDPSGGLIQNVGKVVLGEQRVGGVCAVRIGPWFVLVLARGINNTC